MTDKLLTYDIETLKVQFLLCIYDHILDEFHEFEVSEGINNLDAFMKFVESHTDHYWIGFNNLRFDSQVIEFIIRNYEHWHDFSPLEISRLIYQKAQDTIDDSNYNVPPEYTENNLSLKQIDLFTMWHFNNENRRTSLKAVEFAINFENIEEMSVFHGKADLSEEEKQEIRYYCKNDVMATYQLYLITVGETELPLYKGKNKIADREVMEAEFGLKCLNWDDVKIGAEWNKMDYVLLTKANENLLKPSKINYFYGKRFKDFFPKTVKFQTQEMKTFIRELGESFVLNKKQEFKFKFNDELTATIAKGGIHSNETGRHLIPEEDEEYWQEDIGSQYPNAIRKYKIEPKHLPGWNTLIVSKIERRLKYKAHANETGDKKSQSLQEMGKLSLNGGAYGRLNTRGDWQEDPSCMLQVTIGCQLEILMIVEELILKGFRVVSLNTDGFDAIIMKDRREEFHAILTKFERIIGNDTLGQFEHTEFEWIAQTSVNDYIALKKNGKIKVKGDFEVDKELHKNNSARIVPIALREYFINNTPVEDTIKNHTNIYDFCLRQKSSKNFHYEGLTADGKTTIYNKLIRYIVTDTGEKLYKIKNPECQTNAPAKSQVESGEWLMKVVNYLPKTKTANDFDINYNYYTMRAETILRRIVTGNRRSKPFVVVPNQLSLFD